VAMRFITLLCCFLIASVASAKDFRYAVVDMQKLFNDYPGTDKAKDKLSSWEKKKSEDLNESAQEISDLETELGGSSSMLSSAQKKRKLKEHDDKVAAFKQQRDQVQKEVMAKEAEMTQQLVDEIKAIVAGIAKDNNVDVVFDLDKTVYANSPLDLTKAVEDKYKKLKDDSDSDSKK
jgi:Skp family chaperone for outer membrane proteins